MTREQARLAILAATLSDAQQRALVNLAATNAPLCRALVRRGLATAPCRPGRLTVTPLRTAARQLLLDNPDLAHDASLG